MKKVKNKIIALMLVIPLLLMFSLSTAAKTVEVLVDVPVSSISLTVNGEKELEYDVTSGKELKLVAKIEPSTATHTKVIYQTQQVEGKKQADVLISEDGIITPTSVGSVVILAVAGGKKDSVIVNFTAEQVAEASQITENVVLNQGQTKKLAVGVDYELNPSSAKYESVFSSSNPSVVSVNAQGELKAKFAGESKVELKIGGIKYDSAKEKFESYDYVFVFNVRVNQTQSDDALSFDGGKNETTVSSFADPVTYVDMFVDKTKITVSDLSFDFDESVIENVSLERKEGFDDLFVVKIEWKEAATKGDYRIKVKIAESELGMITVNRGKIDWAIDYTGECFIAQGRSKDIDVTVSGVSDYHVTYSSADTKIATVIKRNENLFKINALSEGATQITATLIVDDEVYETKELTVIVKLPYNSITIKNNETTASLNTSLAKELVLGGYEYKNGELSDYSFIVPVNVSFAAGVVEKEIDFSKLVWKTSNDRIATVTNGVVSFGVESGAVTVTVESAFNEVLGYDVKASVTLTVVRSAVNVSNYDDLMRAEKEKKEVVLQSDIYLAPLLKENYSDENWRASGYKDYIEGKGAYTESVYKTIDPTADVAYYDALGRSSDAKLKYFVEFTNNVYGNGHFIDADYLTKGGQSMYASDNAKGFIFNGPLSLVKISYLTESTATDNASIKSQDNIVFLVRYDNISLRNVELKGCSDSSVGNNLSNLDYCGTVLEVSGDNFDMSYCKVNNGRTVVRIYGRAYENEEIVKSNLSKYKTHSEIRNCILTYGREFILKIGTNQLKRGENIADSSVKLAEKTWYPGRSDDYRKYYDQANPYFTKEDGTPYSTTEEKDDYFIENYVLNDVLLQDSVFVGAGLFAIGLDSQFGGLVLDGWNYSDNYRFGTEKGWGNVAGTSYPARLKFAGDVRVYDWKKISSVNSDTLLEAGDTVKEKLHLNLNISDLIESFRKSGSNDAIVNKLTFVSGGESYINSAVAFYGGGKNYSVLDTSAVDEAFSEMFELSIDVKYFAPSHPQLIYYSAGIEPFRFMVYEASSSNENYLTYDKQLKDLSDNSAYVWIYRK